MIDLFLPNREPPQVTGEYGEVSATGWLPGKAPVKFTGDSKPGWRRGTMSATAGEGLNSTNASSRAMTG